MKICVPRDELKVAVAGLGRVINPRAPVPILSSLRLDAEGQTIRLTGTSIDQTATYELQALEPIPAPVSTLIPIDALQTILKTAQGPEIVFEPGKDSVTITATVAGQGIGRRVETPDIKD